MSVYRKTKDSLAALSNTQIDLLLIFGFALLSRGSVLNMSGIWWDDWAWVWHYFGSSNMGEFMIPFKWLRHTIVGYILAGNFKLFGLFYQYTSNVWCVLRLATFVINAFLIYSIARKVVRDETPLPLWISFFYLASPVVNNLALVTFDYHLLVLVWLVSVMLSVKAVEKSNNRKILTVFALLSSFLAMVSLESFVFLDLLRLLLFFYIFRARGMDRTSAMKRSMFCWFPYLLIGVVVLLDTVLRPQSGAYTGTYSTGQLSFTYFGIIMERYLDSLKYIFLSIYIKTLKHVVWRGGNILILFSAVAATVYASFFLFYRYEKSDPKVIASSEHNSKSVLFFGLFAVLVGLLPYALTREAVSYGLASRHGLLASIGVSIVLPSLILMFYRKSAFVKRVCRVALVTLIFLGVAQNNYSTNVYSNNWEHQRSIWWQLMWRAPDIKDHTLMIIDMPWGESPGGGSFVLPGALNLIYAKNKDKTEIFNHYAFAFSNAFRRDETDFASVADRDVVEFGLYRGKMRFYPKNLIAASYQGGYLYFIDEINSSPWIGKKPIDFLKKHVSHDRIIYSTAARRFPFRWILGPEPQHDWRYYYQKANALAGRKDYSGTTRLYEDARDAGYNLDRILPRNLAPFIKSFYLLGDLAQGDYLLERWIESSWTDQNMINDLLQSSQIVGSPEVYKRIKDISEAFSGSKDS